MSECYDAVPWQAWESKPVEVNQRALISKVLARYPGEFTLFRELLQNSDDAHSSNVEIHFSTATSRLPPPDPKSSDVVRWIFKNDGKPFEERDWTRLARIAEGNPDPAKVGAFGVGFYSLFSVTDSPYVSSGGHGMQFYWKDGGDQLHARQGDLPTEGTLSAWTEFVIPLREPCQMPSHADFMRFLATSITFMANLKEVRVFLNEYRIGRITKVPGPSESVELPIVLEHTSPEKMMVVDGIQRHHFTIHAEVSIISQESSSADVPESSNKCKSITTSARNSLPHLQIEYPTGLCTAELHLTVFTAEVDVKVDEKLSKELRRCTAKEPPSRVKYSLVYTGKDEYDQCLAGQENQRLMSIFQGLRADLEEALHPRIFIGHSTSQTTGIGGHMEAPFIPTVERESIDLVEKNVAIWNNELLYVGGFLCRAVYELELSAIQTAWERVIQPSNTSNSRPSLESQGELRKRFIHILKFFTFHHTTPSVKVAQQLRTSFYQCSTLPLRFLSSVGVRNASNIRMFDPLCDKFLKHVPMLLPDVAPIGEVIIKALPDEHKMRIIALSDVLQDLHEHTLDEEELVACLQWQVQHSSTPGVTELLQVACFRSADGTTIKLSSIHNFVDSDGLGAHIPPNGPLPPSLISPRITKHFPPKALSTFGWRPFTVVDWLKYICDPGFRSANAEHDFLRSVQWAECVLHSVSLAWPSSEEIRLLAKSAFTNMKCIPVMHNLCNPEDTYLPGLNIPEIDDLHLPIVQLPSGRGISAPMERLLKDLGVRQHLPPQLLLKQMVETEKWKTSDLINYLVRAPLSPEELSELRLLTVFAQEGIQGGGKKRYRADELYPPMEGLRQLHMPLIEWEERSNWQDTTPEAELLYRLGLRRHPPVEVVIDLCSSPDASIRTNAFTYLCANLRSAYSEYDPNNFRHIAFIPAENTDGPCLEKLGDVFLDKRWKIFGFPVVQHVRSSWENTIKELGVWQHPPSSCLLQLLETTPPSNEGIAHQWFEILFEHTPNFAQHEIDKLSQLQMVPKIISGKRMYLTPVQCYLGRGTNDEFYSKLFHFVNFGPVANRFLDACGAKNEPSEKDIAESLLDDPDRFYKLADGHQRFLKEMRELAVRHTRITNETLSKMMSEPVLLGVRREKTANPDGWENTYSLCKPGGIVIVDDIEAYQLFDGSLTIAPRDIPPELEHFYALLGCRHLSTIIQDQCKASGEIQDATMCSKYRDLVSQRLPIFRLHRSNPLAPNQVPWPSSAGGIAVRLRGHLSVSKTLTIGNKKILREQGVWATARYEQGTIQVWLSRSAKEDKYGLAVSLCRVLFRTVNLNDALLLTTILSENMEVLRRRGYEVDQVPRHQRLSGECGLTGANPCWTPSGLLSINPKVEPPVAETGLGPMVTSACVQTTGNHSTPLEGGEPVLGSVTASVQFPLVTNFINNVRDALRVGVMSRAESSGTGTSTTVLPPSPWSPRQVMPRSYIRSNVSKAIEACNPRERIPVYHHEQVDVTKFLNGYCNVSEPIGNLQPLGKMDNVDVYAGQDILDTDTFMERMHEPLSLFVRIILPVAEIYKLPIGSLRIFYNLTAGCIAFNNRKGFLYLNLRYFEAWHYQDVKNGNAQQAQCSWFLTLAHEMAHNLVTRHDSEHEFWFSAICEAYMDAFSQLLQRPSSV